MKNNIFEPFKFDIGFISNTKINFWNKDVVVNVEACAYREEDGITDAQYDAFKEFSDNKKDKIVIAQGLLTFYDKNAQNRFTLQSIIFNRDGSYAFLINDNEDIDNGLVVDFTGKPHLTTQDEYL